MSFKASDLLKKDRLLLDLRKANYRLEYQKCVDHVKRIHDQLRASCTEYEVPWVLASDNNYIVEECVNYLKEKLALSEFYVRTMKPGNIIYISWDPEHVQMVQKKNETKNFERHMREQEEKHRAHENKDRKSDINNELQYNPKSHLSELHLKSQLMIDNPKYAHLSQVQKVKKKKRRVR